MAAPSGERRIVATLFADVAGSTAIAEQLGPDRSKFLFDEVVRLMADRVRAYGGTVAQLTGDGLFAVFGAPVAHEDDSERAVRAARAIQAALAAYGEEVGAAYGIELAARVAVNTGPVVLVLGEHSDEERFNALGDTANVAARLQALAGDGGVAVGPETARQISRAFVLEDLGALDLKGKSSPVRAYRVTGELDVASPASRTPLVGRRHELGILTRVLDDLVDGRGAVVAVIGEPGIGKSRLVAEACERAEGVRVLAGHALSYTETIPYWPVRDLLRDWLGLGVSDAEARARLELKAALARAVPDEADELYPFLAAILGLALEPEASERLAQLSRDSVQQQTFDSVVRLAAGLAAERPLCLVVEDLHWADDSTLELLEELLAVSDDEAVAIMLLYRSERDHRAWELGQSARRRLPHRYQELELTPLDATDSRLLATGAAGAELPEALVSLIAERAGGNPFFVEEALADLVERGVVHRRNGRYEFVNGTAELTVPVLVQEALQARLDRLDASTREVANVASVIGRDFGLQLLERVAPEIELRRPLSELQRLDLVVEKRRRPAPEYRFRHGLVQEVAYRSLLDPRRRELHGAVGRALEELHQEAPAEVYGLLAWHFGESEQREKAVDYLLKAGDGARAIYANQEAREFYRQALDLMSGDDPRARVTLLKLGLSHHLAFEFEQASHAYERAFLLPVGPPARSEPSARIEVLFEPVYDLTPGHAYDPGTIWFVHQLFRGLVTVDAELNVLPDLAEQFAISPDGLSYRFRLRADASWSDGAPVTAEDFAYTLTRVRDENLAGSGLLQPIETAAATDQLTLEIRLRRPLNGFLYLLAMPYAFAWPKHRCEALGDAWREPANLVGNGPFVLVAFDREHATLRGREAWHGPRGNVWEASIRFMKLEPGAAAVWRTGRGDTMATSTEWIADDEDTVVEISPAVGTWYLAFRTDEAPFDDERIRRAFALALDTDSMAKVWKAAGQPVGRGGFVPPQIAGHSHRVGLPHDPAGARALLAEAGHADGRGLPVLTLVIPEGAFGAGYGRPLVDAWEAVGARVRVEGVEMPGMRQALTRCHLWCWGWVADFPDPDAMLRVFLADSPILDDPEISALLERAASLRNQDERLQAYREIDRLLVAERVALVPLHYDRMLLASRPWIAGLHSLPLLPHGGPLDWLEVDEARRARRSREAPVRPGDTSV
jgi:ABC-type transport system substrate-binding protein/class 3 adenylate cyclase